jgi:hypothetical protein
MKDIIQETIEAGIHFAYVFTVISLGNRPEIVEKIDVSKLDISGLLNCHRPPLIEFLSKYKIDWEHQLNLSKDSYYIGLKNYSFDNLPEKPLNIRSWFILSYTSQFMFFTSLDDELLNTGMYQAEFCMVSLGIERKFIRQSLEQAIRGNEKQKMDYWLDILEAAKKSAKPLILDKSIVEGSKIFISYAREDLEHAERMYQDLKNEGFNPWLDTENLLPGQDWKSLIKKEIKNCRFFIALLSSNSITKRGYCQKELGEALETVPDSGIFLIPVRLDNCKPSNEKLNQIHRVDIWLDWDEGMKKIIKAMISDAKIKTEAEQSGQADAPIGAPLTLLLDKERRTQWHEKFFQVSTTNLIIGERLPSEVSEQLKATSLHLTTTGNLLLQAVTPL